MADSVPAVGSLISLISRTGIRYQGSMYTVDLNDSTIALSHGKRQRDRRRAVGRVRERALARERRQRERKGSVDDNDPEVATAPRHDSAGRARCLFELCYRVSMARALHCVLLAPSVLVSQGRKADEASNA